MLQIGTSHDHQTMITRRWRFYFLLSANLKNEWLAKSWKVIGDRKLWCYINPHWNVEGWRPWICSVWQFGKRTSWERKYHNLWITQTSGLQLLTLFIHCPSFTENLNIFRGVYHNASVTYETCPEGHASVNIAQMPHSQFYIQITSRMKHFFWLVKIL